MDADASSTLASTNDGPIRRPSPFSQCHETFLSQKPLSACWSLASLTTSPEGCHVIGAYALAHTLESYSVRIRALSLIEFEKKHA